MDPQAVVIVAVVIVMGWFALGLLYNLRRGNAVLRWMQSGLPLIGEKTTFRWLGSSVAEMGIQKAKRPFKEATVMMVLAPRDVPWFWVISALSGRRDLLIFRSQLTTHPPVDLELLSPKSWTGRTALKDAQRKGWSSELYDDQILFAPAESIQAAWQAVTPWISTLTSAGLKPTRLALRRQSSLFELHLPLPNTSQDAQAYFKAIQSLARQVSERP